ncbi:hypothetical protein ACQP3R_22505 [Bacillus inaquosorum]|uniref:hypothetical protein n=1 Tax=Bacillus inaquosorum TaxID=483913 RepID=UPI003D058D08
MGPLAPLLFELVTSSSDVWSSVRAVALSPLMTGGHSRAVACFTRATWFIDPGQMQSWLPDAGLGAPSPLAH